MSTPWVKLDGNAVRGARWARELRQRDIEPLLSQVAGIRWGFGQSRISNMERGRALADWVRPVEATALAAALRVDVWFLLAPSWEQKWEVLNKFRASA